MRCFERTITQSASRRRNDETRLWCKPALCRFDIHCNSFGSDSAGSPFVVSGEAAKRIQDFSMINLATAERIADACENGRNFPEVTRRNRLAQELKVKASLIKGRHETERQSADRFFRAANLVAAGQTKRKTAGRKEKIGQNVWQRRDVTRKPRDRGRHPPEVFFNGENCRKKEPDGIENGERG